MSVVGSYSNQLHTVKHLILEHVFLFTILSMKKEDWVMNFCHTRWIDQVISDMANFLPFCFTGNI